VTVRVEQEATYQGKDHWKWAVWVEGPDRELDAIESVEWTLHPTFKNPVRRVWDRSTKFRIEASGWGEFEINAHAFMKDGAKHHLRHRLHLEYPREEQAEAEQQEPDQRPTVFLARAAADAAWGDAIEEALAERGFEVRATDDALEAGKPWQASIPTAIGEADLVVGVFSDAPSAWVEREIREAISAEVPVVPMMVGQYPQKPKWLGGRQALRVDEPGKLGPAMDLLAKRYSL
jgi:TIR domain/YEATS family